MYVISRSVWQASSNTPRFLSLRMSVLGNVSPFPDSCMPCVSLRVGCYRKPGTIARDVFEYRVGCLLTSPEGPGDVNN